MADSDSSSSSRTTRKRRQETDTSYSESIQRVGKRSRKEKLRESDVRQASSHHKKTRKRHHSDDTDSSSSSRSGERGTRRPHRRARTAISKESDETFSSRSDERRAKRRQTKTHKAHGRDRPETGSSRISTSTCKRKSRSKIDRRNDITSTSDSSYSNSRRDSRTQRKLSRNIIKYYRKNHLRTRDIEQRRKILHSLRRILQKRFKVNPQFEVFTPEGPLVHSMPQDRPRRRGAFAEYTPRKEFPDFVSRRHLYTAAQPAAIMQPEQHDKASDQHALTRRSITNEHGDIYHLPTVLGEDPWCVQVGGEAHESLESCLGRQQSPSHSHSTSSHLNVTREYAWAFVRRAAMPRLEAFLFCYCCGED